ncbi:uncharacterized protein LOC122052660 [Zingiber officinale]|uniref:uncharacterized protein LOC121967438 n=1 Tax=Zingiber officinale TaxID=94328 RepID=UPI001C4CE5EC|nr:uncharacterized protein LOC121967438 [Zingiber officinale]XP_042470243.1 uncharacterized protein LOC122052660 [Zingiber officinale]
MAGEAQEMVEVTVKTIGPARPTRLRVPSSIKVSDLRRIVAAERRLPAERLKLVLRGKTLQDKKEKEEEEEEEPDEDVLIRLQDGDSLILAVVPKPPAKHLQEDDDDEEELKFQIPQRTNWLKKRIFLFLQKKLRFPDIVLMAIFSISLKAWIGIILWFSMAPIAQRFGIGPIYILITGFLIILLNLGKRQHGDLSAYSVFNEDFRELPGTLNADRLDRDIRAGQF